MENNFEEKYNEFLEKQLDRVNTWLTFAEAKNAAIIVFNATIIGFIFELRNEYLLETTTLIIGLLFSLALSLCSFIPKVINRLPTDTESSEPQNPNYLFWGDIATIREEKRYIELTAEKYFPDHTENISENRLSLDLASEIIINSKITTNKYKLFKKAVIVDIVLVIIFVILLIIA